jgi:hypothetical protein
MGFWYWSISWNTESIHKNCGSFYISMWSCLENDRLLLNAKWIVFQLYMIVHWNTPRVEIWYLRFYYHTQHIILFLNQPVFTATPEYCVLGREAANTIFVVLGLTRWPSIPLEVYCFFGFVRQDIVY